MITQKRPTEQEAALKIDLYTRAALTVIAIGIAFFRP